MFYENIEICQETKEKVWGKEFWIVNNQDYCGKILVINKQHRCSIHYHKIKKETFLVVSGEILLEVLDPAMMDSDEQKFIFVPGMSITINPYVKHRFTGMAEVSEIIEFSTRHYEQDSYRITKSEKISDDEWEIIKK